MAYRGLFVGVDRYADDRVAWLSCANRDAVALHALFADTLGPGGVLLGDDRATAAEIRRALGELREADKDDVVVRSEVRLPRPKAQALLPRAGWAPG
jgi:hypothetical protein